MDAIGAYIALPESPARIGLPSVARCMRGCVVPWHGPMAKNRTNPAWGDPESRRTIAWSIVTEADHDGDGELDAASSDNVIGMIFLIDIDGWARSARIQVVLGKDYRGRGYSRDIMPRVMTYGFAPEPAGLGMHRIWVAVPEQNTRSVSVYQSLGFVPSGRSRDALWNASENRYQDLIVMDTLVDEFDPIRSLDAFGMHVIEDNPGVKEALSAREHSIAIQLNSVHKGDADDAAAAGQSGDTAQTSADETSAAPSQESQPNEASGTAKTDQRPAMPTTTGRTARMSAKPRRMLGGARLDVAAARHGRQTMSAEDLDNYETDAELSLYKEYRDVIKLFTYVVETERRFYLPTRSISTCVPPGQDVYFDVRLTDAWVWDVYRSSRFVKNVRIVTFKDVNVEEVQKTDIDIPDSM